MNENIQIDATHSEWNVLKEAHEGRRPLPLCIGPLALEVVITTVSTSFHHGETHHRIGFRQIRRIIPETGMNEIFVGLERIVSSYTDEIEQRINQVRAKLKGRKIKILTDWNGQPYGSSKKSQKGQVHVVEDVFYNPGQGFSLWLGFKFNASIMISDVEFLEEGV